jgi:hypothetical protein
MITAPFTDAFGWITTQWEKLKSMFGMGATVDVRALEGESYSPEYHARGGLFTKPTISAFAERGPEVAVPVGLADRGLGLSNLNLAARALGLGNINSGATSFEFNPTINLTVNGGNPEEVKRVVLDAMREAGASMIPLWQEQIARTAYST